MVCADRCFTVVGMVLRRLSCVVPPSCILDSKRESNDLHPHSLIREHLREMRADM